MKRWYILNRDGSAQEVGELPERPSDARAEEGEAFRPWYKEHEHVHVERGKIQGMHAYGELEDLQTKLTSVLSREVEILKEFGGEEDIDLSQALGLVV